MNCSTLKNLIRVIRVKVFGIYAIDDRMNTWFALTAMLRWLHHEVVPLR
jgi:hypothetical protein